VSDKVNVWREIDADRAGFVAPDTIAGTQRLFASWRALDGRARDAMRAQARRTFDARFSTERMVDALLALLHDAPAQAAARSRDGDAAMRAVSARH